jgi:hypothetical protein
MFTPAGIAFSLAVNTLVPDLYKRLPNMLSTSFDQKVNRAYHSAADAVLKDADQRKISVKQGPAPMGSESYRSLSEFFRQRKFMDSVVQAITDSDPLDSGDLSAVYPPALN